ncbi:MAG: response regulator [Acidimicrobiia bacterium]
MREDDPAAPDPGEPAGVELQSPDIGAGDVQRIRLLFVEDDNRFAELVRYVLSESSPTFEIKHVHRLSSALACLVRQPIDAILTDLQLSDSQGPATVRYLRRAAGGLPVIVLSSNADPEVALESISAGADEYVVKGNLGLNALGRLIMLAIDRRRGLTGQGSSPTGDPLQASGYASGFANLEPIARHLMRVADRVGLHIGMLCLRVNGPRAGFEGEHLDMVTLAGVLRRTLRRCDLVARPSANELAVVLVMQQPDVHNAVSRLADAILAVEGRTPIRMGVATYHPGGPESLEELMEQARHDLRPVHA